MFFFPEFYGSMSKSILSLDPSKQQFLVKGVPSCPADNNSAEQ